MFLNNIKTYAFYYYMFFIGIIFSILLCITGIFLIGTFCENGCNPIETEL